MKLKPKKDCAWSLVVPTSMGVRITPLYGQPVNSSNTFNLQATSAETNVASVSSYLGLPVKVLTTFVKDSPVAQFIKNDLAGRHMTYEGPDVPQGGPWGTVISSTLPTAGMEAGGLVFIMTVPGRLAVY